MMRCACARKRPSCSQPPAKPGQAIASVRVSSRLCAKLSVGTAPRPKRSSGTKWRPKARRAAGSLPDTSSSPMRILPFGARQSSPDKAYSNSRCPLPETPAIPSTSPARTSRQMPAKSTPNWSSRDRRKSRTVKRAAPGSRTSCLSCGGSAPIISLDREALDSSAGLHTPVTLPPRSTVQALHRARISCSLWLMYKILQPSKASCCSTTNSFSTACGVNTEVGSSSISNWGCVSSARMISTRCISPTPSVCTGRAGSMSRPYWRALSLMRSLTWSRLRLLSRPSQTFSATVIVSNKLKC